MKITIAIDSFKGSLSSVEAGCAVRDGILSCYADAEIHISPLADGEMCIRDSVCMSG